MLNKMVLSTITQRVLAFFCLHPEQKFHGREVARRMKEQTSSIQRVIKGLEAEGVLSPERRGKMIFYSLGDTNPLVRPYKVLAVVAALEPLVRKLRGVTDLVVLYGSSARGTYLADSDVDLLVVTSHEDKVREAISRFARGFAKEIRPVIHSLAEWANIEEQNPVYAAEVGSGFTLCQSEYYESRI